MKISVVHSTSPALLESLSRLELIHPVSALAHDAAAVLLSDFGGRLCLLHNSAPPLLLH